MNVRTDEMVQLAAQHGLTLAPESVQLEESGADFLAAFADDTDGQSWVLRMPRRPDVLPRAASEGRALALIRPRLPVATPDWRIQSDTSIAYPRLVGTPGVVENDTYVWHVTSPPPHAAFNQSLGRALAALHGIDPQAAAAVGLNVYSPADARQAVAEKVAQARTILEIPPLVWQHWQAWLADDDRWPPFSALIHGDLHPGHLLLNDAGQVIGIIDWTEAEVNDPAIDFAFVHGLLGANVLADVLAHYAAAGGRAWPGMAQQILARWSLVPASTAVFAQMSGHPEYLDFARSLLAAQEAALQNAWRCSKRAGRINGSPSGSGRM